jgi:RNA polymerase-binding transcription factor DksA
VLEITPEKEASMTERDAGQIRERLERLREQLTTGRENLPVSEDAEVSDYGAGGHYADDATNVFLRARNVALHGNADDIVAQIDAALARADAGSYGMCENCGRAINPERLEVLPYTIYCVECAAEIQRRAAEAPQSPPSGL